MLLFARPMGYTGEWAAFFCLGGPGVHGGKLGMVCVLCVMCSPRGHASHQALRGLEGGSMSRVSPKEGKGTAG